MKLDSDHTCLARVDDDLEADGAGHVDRLGLAALVHQFEDRQFGKGSGAEAGLPHAQVVDQLEGNPQVQLRDTLCDMITSNLAQFSGFLKRHLLQGRFYF